MNNQLRFTRHSARRAGFSLTEVLFAVGMLGVGIVGVLSLFTTGISAAAWSKNMTTGAMEAQSLYTRLVSEVDTSGKRIYLTRIVNPQTNVVTEWIHGSNNNKTPVRVDPDRDLWWQCRASRYPMDPDYPLDSTKDKTSEKPHPTGLFQVAIAVFRNSSEAFQPKEPIVVYTTFVTAGY